MRRTHTLQRGGARDHLNSSGYTPDITNVNEMMEKTSFYYLSCHGSTQHKQMMIIPDDTFLIFTGSSGYFVFQAIKRDHASMGRMNLDRLLTYEYAEGATPADKLTNYINDLYSNFFEGNYSRFRMYPGMQIFCPGDIIQSHICTFNADATGFVTRTGMYALPVSKEDCNQMAVPAEGAASNDLLIFLSIYYGVDEEVTTAYNAAEPKDRATLDPLLVELKALSTINEKWERVKVFLNPIVNSDYNYENTIFDKPDELHHVLTKYAYNKPNNELITQGIRGNPFTQDNSWYEHIPLYDILDKAKPEASKKYKFFIFSGCRAPIGLTEVIHPENAAVPFITHKTIAANAEKSRVTARRMSYVTKEIPEECALGKQPGLNLGKLREIYNNKPMYDTTMRLLDEYDIFLKTAGPTFTNYKEPLREFFKLLRYMFFSSSPKGAHIPYIPFTRTWYLGNFLNTLLGTSYYLNSTLLPDKYGTSREYCLALVNESKEIFGKFMLELREGFPEYTQNLMSIGRLLLKSIDEENKGLPELNLGVRILQGRAEAEVVAPFLEVRTAADEAKRIKDIKKNFLTKKNLLQNYYIGNFKDFFIDSVKAVLDKIHSNLQRNARTNTTLEVSLEKTREHLSHLLNGTPDGHPDESYKRVFNVPEYLASYDLEFDFFTNNFSELPEATEIISQIAQLRGAHVKGIQEYEQLKQFLETRIGDLGIAIQEELEAAANSPKPVRYNNILQAFMNSEAAHTSPKPVRYNNMLKASMKTKAVHSFTKGPMRRKNKKTFKKKKFYRSGLRGKTIKIV